MGANRKKKGARKQAAKIPTWLFDKDVSVLHKREVEDALARHAADNGITVASARFRALTLQDICASLRLVNAARWSAVGPEMIHAATQPAMKVLTTHLQSFKKKQKVIEQMVADLKAAGDGSQSSQGSAEEGEEEEEEEAQADDSSASRGHDKVMDGEPAGPKHAYAEGNPHELLRTHASAKAEVEEGAAADGQSAFQGTHVSAKTEPLVTQVLNKIEEAIQAREAGQRTQLRVTAEDVHLWTEIGERCKRVKYYWDELEKEEAAIVELIRPTPLAYSWTKVRELASDGSDSAKSQSEQPAPADEARD